MQESQQKTHKLEVLKGQPSTRKLGIAPSERFEMIEERLLLFSVPSYFFVIVLVIISSTFASIPWIAISTHMLISLMSVSIAFILLRKWVAVLQKMYTRTLADRGNEVTLAISIGVACICVLLAGLIVLVAVHAGELSAPSLVLLFVLPIMLIWQYRYIIFGAHEK